MPVPVKFVLSRRDLVPPVYLAGSFTQWQANLLMDFAARTDEQQTWNEFSKTVELEPGVYQYKFRLGDGDWWITDDTHEKITDNSGNVNNSIAVREAPRIVENEEPVKGKEPTPAREDKEVEDKPSPQASTNNKATSYDTASSSNLTIVETSSLLKNRSTSVSHQAETYGTVNAQNHETTPGASVETSEVKTGRPTVNGDAKGTTKSRGAFSRLFCFCSSTAGMSLAGFGTVLVAAYMIHLQVN